MLQMTFVNCIAILSNYFGGEVKFVLVAKVNKSLTRIFSEKISECFRINTNASKTWLKYRPIVDLRIFLFDVVHGFGRDVVRPWTVPNLGRADREFELWTGSNMGSSDLEFGLENGPSGVWQTQNRPTILA